MNASNSADHAVGAELQGELRDLLCSLSWATTCGGLSAATAVSSADG